MQYFLHVLKNYAVFKGRARRREYWMFALFQGLFGIVAWGIDYFLSGGEILNNGTVSSLYSLALFVPSLAVNVRRLHDVNKSGWFMLIVFVPLVGVIWLLVLDCTAGDLGPNQYGQDPKDMVTFETPYSY